MRRNKKWNELTSAQQTAILVVGSVELALTATAFVDLARRPQPQVRGSKVWWSLGILVQPIGPIAYLVWGVRRDAAD
ncbi:MAG: PLD nuclease N-terminal domain-containing protein [Actinomycetes bacterium]